MSKIDPGFASELKKYGSGDFSACFNCGNCTAVCSLTDKNINYPRMFLRHGMLGQEKEILESREIWLCYACGDCTETCPRQAGPGDYMAALRRYAIASYEPTGLTRMIFRNNPVFIGFTLFLAILLGLFLFTLKPDHIVARWIFEMIPYAVIHTMGLVIFSLTGISIVWGLVTMVRKLTRQSGKGENKKTPVPAALKEVMNELATMKRYRTCDREEDSYWKDKPALLQPWFLHWSIMWGFLGLLAATVLDFLLKDPATAIWWPSRILGTAAGIFLVYGTSLAGWYRLKKVTKSYEKTRLADALFLGFLWMAGITGFWLEISVAFGADWLVNHLVLLVHTILSMELVLLFAFSKFAHAVYRPLALYYYFREAPGKN
ncbi:MAG TPA: 4Fe-4S dicluster domain-containing protein [Bacteroidales bacterium]|nr:4Fe-4S dicluster domain-containing protein [Bacteroidales bacterium]